MAPRARPVVVLRRAPGPRGSRVVAFAGVESNQAAAAKFSRELREKVQGLNEQQVRTVQTKLALDFVRIVVKGTPVDTGRARGGWQVEIGREPPVQSIIDPTGAATFARANDKLTPYRRGIGDPKLAAVWITNGVPYIEVLDRGLKRQRFGKNAGALIPYSARGSRFFERGINYLLSQFR